MPGYIEEAALAEPVTSHYMQCAGFRWLIGHLMLYRPFVWAFVVQKSGTSRHSHHEGGSVSNHLYTKTAFFKPYLILITALDYFHVVSIHG